ncbi:MAG TPA: phosphate ABC transporter substrate-binding protein PstS [Tepidisphaeraceae bacterium]|jgi:phosphate transport system substrate-binding protein|nr:phosphate ABC transporter substrate-binding protein PstS [Tepidisphaeraceae bacterium]
MFRTAAAFALTISLGAIGSVFGDVKIQGGGATFPAPLYQRWVSDYQNLHPDVKIDYQAIGSGGGIKGITDKTFDFAGSDAPMNKSEMAGVGGAANVVEIPSCAGAVVLAYNLPDLKGDLKLDGATLASIFMGKITNWNDPAIKALNPGVDFPDMPITTVHRADGSGTNFVFTNYLATQSEEFKENVGIGKQVEWPNGQGAGQNVGVAGVVKQTKGAIGYIELAYAIDNSIPFALLKNKDGNFVKASPDTVSQAGEGALSHMNKSLAVPIWNQTGKDAYPIASFTYLIVYKDLSELKDPNKAKALADFLRWAVTDGEKTAPQLKYAPLSEGVAKKVMEQLDTLNYSGTPLK